MRSDRQSAMSSAAARVHAPLPKSAGKADLSRPDTSAQSSRESPIMAQKAADIADISSTRSLPTL